jgi:hypothetical protein
LDRRIAAMPDAGIALDYRMGRLAEQRELALVL